MSGAKKKEKKMSKTDFDFSGISGEKRHKKPPSDKPKEEVVTGKTETKRGICLSIPSDEGGWVSKDIAEVTVDEFLAWASGVYPAQIEVEKSKLESLSAKVTIFNKILRYHMYSPFQVGKMDPTEKPRKILPN